MADRVIHISEAEAARNFADVLARVRAGTEVVIESRLADRGHGTALDYKVLTANLRDFQRIPGLSVTQL